MLDDIADIGAARGDAGDRRDMIGLKSFIPVFVRPERLFSRVLVGVALCIADAKPSCASTDKTRRALKSSADAAFQISRAHVPFDISVACGNTETPFVMNRKIGRPAAALQTARAGGIGQSTTHLLERGFGIGFAKSGIRRIRRGQI